MANISGVAISADTYDFNTIPTSKNFSTFRIKGGKYEPGGWFVDRLPDGSYTLINFEPSFEGQLVWSSIAYISPEEYIVIPYRALLYIAVVEGTRLVFVPVNRYYIPGGPTDASTGKPVNPVGEYVCDPPWLCPSET